MAGLSLKRRRQAPAEETTAFAGVAERFRRAGDLDRAITLCREGLQKFPDLLSARVTLGWALLDKGDFADARIELQSVLKRAPDNLAAIRGLAELHDRADNAEGSMESWQQPAEAEPVEVPQPAPRASKSRAKSKAVAEPPPEPEISRAADQVPAQLLSESEPEFTIDSEPGSVVAEGTDPVEVAATAIFTAAEASIDAADVGGAITIAPPQAIDSGVEVVASGPSPRDPLSDMADLAVSEVEIVLESPAAASVAAARTWADTRGQAPEVKPDSPLVDAWEEPSPAVSEAVVAPQSIDGGGNHEAWEDPVPAARSEVVAEPPAIDLVAASLAEADLGAEAVVFDTQTAGARSLTHDAAAVSMDADIILDAATTAADEAAELERLLASVELDGAPGHAAVVLEDVLDPAAVVAPENAVPLVELVTVADLAVGEGAEPPSLENLAKLPEAPTAVTLVTAAPAASSSEAAEQAEPLLTLPALDAIPVASAERGQPAPAANVRPETVTTQPALDVSVKDMAEQGVTFAAPPVAEPAVPEAGSHQSSGVYEPATWHLPAAWHERGSGPVPTAPPPSASWLDDLPAAPAPSFDEVSRSTAGGPHASIQAVAPRTSRKHAQVAALEKLLRRVEARRVRLGNQSVA